MISEKQLAANRANALKSTGPRTEEGKERSRLNAGRHHLTGQVTIMTDPDRAAYNKFLKDMIADLAPVGALETQLAQRIATDHWRLNRAAAIEENLFAMGIGRMGEHVCQNHPEIEDCMNQARVYTIRSKQLNLLSLYEQRINRSIQKNMEVLKQLQSDRRVPEALVPAAPGIPLYGGARSALVRPHVPTPAATPLIPQPVDPQRNRSPNGFVFSNDPEGPITPDSYPQPDAHHAPETPRTLAA